MLSQYPICRTNWLRASFNKGYTEKKKVLAKLVNLPAQIVNPIRIVNPTIASKTGTTLTKIHLVIIRGQFP